MTVSPWTAVALALPVLLCGEQIVRRVRILNRFNIPEPVAGGLLVALLVLVANLSGLCELRFETNVSQRWWTWLVCTPSEWAQTPVKNVTQPLLVAFFACIGLNASWSLVKRGTVQVGLFLGVALVLVVLQNLIGVGLATALHVPRMLGLVCGSVSMTGGHGTVMGFAQEFEAAGLDGAAVMGVAAATFGLVAGGLIGGPIGGGLIRGRGLRASEDAAVVAQDGQDIGIGILYDLRRFGLSGVSGLYHLVLVLVCVKLGTWVSVAIQSTGITFPVYIGAMFVGVGLRNVADLIHPHAVRTERIDILSSILLGVFLTIAMMSLNLIELTGVAKAMMIILVAQVVLTAAFARFVTFRVMGGDYDAAVMAAGQCGFGLGAMPNAIANMQAVTERYGHAPRAFLVVPITGTFLIDLFNATAITFFIHALK
ncbi:MAG TPA: sodium/glutamate symporter [Kiritimatiellia bacterium]|nr:sodium/glutamate symporter [Kiritimatiellia bacterium]HRU69537.1 sodium/glutamate symporter [Kiritimatiellia bacterium]